MNGQYLYTKPCKCYAINCNLTKGAAPSALDQRCPFGVIVIGEGGRDLKEVGVVETKSGVGVDAASEIASR